MTRALRSIAMLPRKLLINPILTRELRVAGRKRSTYINRAGFALLLAVGIVFVMLTMTRSYGWAGDSIVYRAQELTRTVQFITFAVLWTGFAMLTLLGPVLTAGSICDERRARTLDTLATTPISPLQIVVGKLVARMQEAVTLALIAAPALLALRVFGGVPGETIIAFVVIALATTYLGAALGIWFSTWHRGAAGAIVYAFLTLGLLTVAPAIIGGVARQNDYYGLADLGVPQNALPWIFNSLLLACPPVPLAFEMTNVAPPGGFGGVLGFFANRLWLATAIWLTLQATIFVLIAARSVRVQLAKAEEGGSVKQKANQPAESSRVRSLRNAPVFWRESTASIFPKLWHMIAVLGVLAAFIAWAYARIGMDEGTLHQLFGFAGLALVALLAAVSTTGAISSEREAQTWDVLMTVPLSGAHILASKILASARRIAIPIGLLMLHFVAAALLGHIRPFDVALIPLVLASVAAFYLATGLLFSMIFKKIITAVACNIILVITLWAAIPIAALIMMEIVFDSSRRAEDIIGTAVFIYHPAAMLAGLLQHAIDAGPGSWNVDYRLADQQVGLPIFAIALAGNAAAHMLGAALAFALTLRVFHARGGRSS